jgi:hypothetical protein
MLWSRWNRVKRPKPKPRPKSMGPAAKKQPPMAIEEIRRQGLMLAGGPSTPAAKVGEPKVKVPSCASSGSSREPTRS